MMWIVAWFSEQEEWYNAGVRTRQLKMNIRMALTVAVNKILTITILLLLACQTAVAFECGDYILGGPTGTYSDIKYYKRSGDIGGTEIYIVKTNDGYQGTFYFAEGGPSRIALVRNVNIDKKGTHIEFRFKDNGTDMHFGGNIINGNLKGLIKFETGGIIEVNLEKKESYWSYDPGAEYPFRFGSYSNMRCNGNRDSLTGSELRIILGNNYRRFGYIGILQLAGDELSGLMLVECKLEGDDFSFTIREPVDIHGEFKGTYSKKHGIKGTLRFEDGKSIILDLPPHKGFWDR